jgi:hypothetical protein
MGNRGRPGGFLKCVIPWPPPGVLQEHGAHRLDGFVAAGKVAAASGRPSPAGIRVVDHGDEVTIAGIGRPVAEPGAANHERRRHATWGRLRNRRHRRDYRIPRRAGRRGTRCSRYSECGERRDKDRSDGRRKNHQRRPPQTRQQSVPRVRRNPSRSILLSLYPNRRGVL